jgi:hypothetical protein
MFAASQLLAQVELDFAEKRSDALQDTNIRPCNRSISLLPILILSSLTPFVTVDVLKRIADLPGNWIPDSDLYNIRRRAHKSLTRAGIDASEPTSTAPPIGEPHSTNTTATQSDDKACDPLPVPIVKRESSEPRTLPLSLSRGAPATKRRLEEESSANEDPDVDRESSKRGRFDRS